MENWGEGWIDWFKEYLQQSKTWYFILMSFNSKAGGMSYYAEWENYFGVVWRVLKH